MVSLDVLSRDTTNSTAERLIAFHEIERHRWAENVLAYGEARRQRGLPKTVDDSVQAAAVARDAQKVRRLRDKFFPSKNPKRGIGHWEWTGKANLRDLTCCAPFGGGVSEEIYRTSYAMLSAHTHGGISGVFGLTRDAFDRICFRAYDLVIRCALEAALFYGKVVRLDALAEFRRMVERVRVVPDQALDVEVLKFFRGQEGSSTAESKSNGL